MRRVKCSPLLVQVQGLLALRVRNSGTVYDEHVAVRNSSGSPAAIELL
jgi:hypothetical protein